MKTKTLFFAITLFILTLSISAFSSIKSASDVEIFSSEETCTTKNCCKGGVCSMSKDGKCSCENCCKDGKCTADSCPMIKKEGESSAAKGGDCCGDSCPMKAKKGEKSKEHKHKAN